MKMVSLSCNIDTFNENTEYYNIAFAEAGYKQRLKYVTKEPTLYDANCRRNLVIKMITIIVYSV